MGNKLTKFENAAQLFQGWQRYQGKFDMTRCSLERSTAQRQRDLIASVASVCTMYLECSLSIAHIFQRLCVAAYLPLLFKGSFRENLAEMILYFLKCTVCFGFTVPLIPARRVLFGLCFILS